MPHAMNLKKIHAWQMKEDKTERETKGEKRGSPNDTTMERSAKKKSRQPEISIEERREQHGKKDKTRTKIDKRFCQQFVLPLLISIITSTKFPQKGRKNAKAYIRPSVEFIILCNEKTG